MTIFRKTLEPTKKDISCPRAKKKLQQDGRSAIMIKSNPISIRKMTHRLQNNNTKEILTLLSF